MNNQTNAEQILSNLKKYILDNYNHKHCAKTEFYSQGNDMDVFYDGCDYGTSSTLWSIAEILGIDKELKKPEEQEYDF